jgi:uncharacterized membrane protein
MNFPSSPLEHRQWRWQLEHLPRRRAGGPVHAAEVQPQHTSMPSRDRIDPERIQAIERDVEQLERRIAVRGQQARIDAAAAALRSGRLHASEVSRVLAGQPAMAPTPTLEQMLGDLANRSAAARGVRTSTAPFSPSWRKPPPGARQPAPVGDSVDQVVARAAGGRLPMPRPRPSQSSVVITPDEVAAARARLGLPPDPRPQP